LFKLTAILKQNCYGRYLEGRGLWGSYGAAELCLGGVGILFDNSIRGTMIIY